jgi:hypothetical protein
LGGFIAPILRCACQRLDATAAEPAELADLSPEALLKVGVQTASRESQLDLYAA